MISHIPEPPIGPSKPSIPKYPKSVSLVPIEPVAVNQILPPISQPAYPYIPAILQITIQNFIQITLAIPTPNLISS